MLPETSSAGAGTAIEVAPLKTITGDESDSRMGEPPPSLREPQPHIIYLLKMFPRFSETFILNEILGLEALGFDVRIFSLKKPNDGRFHAELSRLRARVRYVPEYVLSSPLDYASAFWVSLKQRPLITLSTFGEALVAFNPYALKRWMQALWLTRELRGDSNTGVHCHFALSAPRVAYFLQKLNGNTFTFTAHAKDIFLKNTKVPLMRRKIRASRGVVTVCDYSLTYMKSGFAYGLETKLRRIYNGVDLTAFTPPDFDERSQDTILSVSRLVEKKGIDVLLRACAILRDRNVRFRCRIAGDGNCAAALRNLSHDLGLGDHVQFTGPLTQDLVRHELHACALMVAPCLQAEDGNVDALPTSLLEALATGTPIVSTTVSGIPEIVTDGEQGVLVELGNATMLADAIEAMLRDPKRRRQMGLMCRARAEERFDRRAADHAMAEFLLNAHGPGGNPDLRVGYVVTMFPRLSETFIAREIQELERQGISVTIFSQKRPGRDDIVDGDAVRAKIVYLSPWWRVATRALGAHINFGLHSSGYRETLQFVRSRPNVPNLKKFYRAALIAREAQQQNLQLLHCHFISANTRLGRFASQMSSLPYSATAHAKDIYATAMSEREMKRRLKEAAFVATISEANREYLSAVEPNANIVVIPNALNLQDFKFCEATTLHTPLRILAVGRLVPKKGFSILLDAIRQLQADGFSTELRIIGEGEERAVLEDSVRANNLSAQVQLIGALSQSDLRDQYSWADMLVVPSVEAAGGDIDGVPVVLLEAMALGVPVITSRISGIPELVRDGDTGLLVEPGDSLQLATAIAGMGTRDIAALTLRARQYVEMHHDIRQTCAQLISQMHEAIKVAAA